MGKPKPNPKTTSNSRAKSSPTSTSSSQPPNWPPLKPLIPPSDLILETLIDNQIYTIPNFFTQKLCQTYVNFLKTLPLVKTPGIPKKGDAVRVNDRFQIEDPRFAQRLWVEVGLRELVFGGQEDENSDGLSEEERRERWGGEVLGLNPNIRIYRYTPGQFFDQHYDESNNILLPPSGSEKYPTPAKTTWTLLLYLTSASTGCEGGQTAFYPDPDDMAFKDRQFPDKEVVVELQTGMALLHRHGDECMLHEGREVTKGEKWVIRSDLCVRR